MSAIEVQTPEEFIRERERLELLLINSWLTFPSLRKKWTPEPSEFGTEERAALADACRWVAREHPDRDRELDLLIPAAMSAQGTLKKWPHAQSKIPVACHNQPEKGLEQWRALRCLIATRRSLVEALLRLNVATEPAALRSAILEASALTSVSGQALVWSDAERIKLAVDHLSAKRGAGSFTGVPELDAATGGVRAGHVWVLGAPTNWGKSSWLLGVSERYLEVHGSGVLLVTCEDEPLLLALRTLCRRAGIRGSAARDSRPSGAELTAAVAALSDASKRGSAPVLLDGRGRAVEDLAEDIRRCAKLHGTRLVLVDYLQCISTRRDTQDRRAEINHVARTLTDAIKTSGCAGILASQLTGEDIRESRDVEHAAEVVLIGRKSDEGELSLHLKKNKTGATGHVLPLQWDSITGSFASKQSNAEDFDGYFTDA